MKKLKYGLLGTAAALALAMTVPALSHAEPGKRGHGGMFFGMTELEKDGEISRDAFRAAAETRFEAMDKDGDGFLTKEEMSAAREQMHETFKERRGDPAERFAAMDADGDGRVTLEEMKQAAAERKGGELSERHAGWTEKFFEKADTDGDGALTLEEMQAAKQTMRDGKGEAKREGPKDGKRGDHFARLDTDGDGRVSRDEFLAGADRMFERLDRNSDGKIERGEGREKR
jgi:Ca2+-binding EF-hand superfamily protein